MARGDDWLLLDADYSQIELRILAHLSGDEELIRAFIANGSARMPGFKTMYKPEQIAAIASYIKTLPKPAAAEEEPADRPRIGAEVVQLDRFRKK